MQDGTALGAASGCGSNALVKALLTHPKLNVNTVYKNGSETALIAAVARGELTVVRTLLADARVDVNARIFMNNPNKTTTTWTALLLAVSTGNTLIVQELLADPRVDVNMIKMTVSTPFHSLTCFLSSVGWRNSYDDCCKVPST